MAKHDLTIIGALVALRELTFDDAKSIAAFCDDVDTKQIVPISVEAAIDLALQFFNPPADEAEVTENDHNHDTCPGCGGPMEDEITELDFNMAVDLWIMARDMVRARDEC